MTDAPKRIWSEQFWQNSEKWGYAGLKQAGNDIQYVRADIADEMLEALRVTSELLEACTFPTAIIRGQYVDRKEAVSRANAAIAKAEGGDK